MQQPAYASPTAIPAVSSTVSTSFVDALLRLGVTHAYGVMGGAIAPFFHAVAHSAMTALHLRHEAGAAFAAVEHSLAARRPVLVFTTAGPGLTNALTGMLAARWEGAHVLYVSAATSAANRGRVATQETGPSAFAGLHFAATIEHPAQLAPALAQLAAGFARPGGFVAHVALPIDVQRAPCPRMAELGARHVAPVCPPAVIAAHAARFSVEPPLIWLGYGARHAAAPIRELVERLGARVMCSPRAKGIVPEDHPRFLGVTGLGGHTRVDEVLAAERPSYTLVLGTRMGESTSFWAPDLAPARSFIHVDVDATAFGAAYPDVPTEGVLADIAGYVTDLLGALGRTPTLELPATITITEDARPVDVPRSQPRREGPVRPQYLLEELQRLAIDGGDAWVMAESGNAFCWATHHLAFREPGRYRVSTGFGSMGHATTGVVGASVARGGKAIALVGDGAMMMLNELHAAVQYRTDALWIVLNDACYLMCAQGMRVMGWEPFSCDLPRVDFVGLARAIGADGARVSTEAEVTSALERALRAKGPFVLDVNIDPREAPPSGRRNKSLMQQGMKEMKEVQS